MKNTTNPYVGVDVCKSKLDVKSCTGFQEVSNQSRAIAPFLDQLIEINPDAHLICEATGGYERCLVESCHQRGIPVSVVNALKVRHFANAKGMLAKTDTIDAAVLREFGNIFRPLPNVLPTPQQRELSAMVRRRCKLVGQLTAEKNALDKATTRLVRNDIAVCVRHLEKRIRLLEKHIQDLILSNAEMREKKRLMEQIQGVGSTLSSLLIAEMPELGRMTDKKAARLVGVAPLNRDSGKWRGKRTIHGGRSLVRRGLYMPALSAATHNPILKAFYQRLRNENKPHHVAITAVIRKLVCLINRILSDPDFVPAK